MKNICLKSLLAIFAFSMFLSCSKDDSISSSLTGKWYYYSYTDSDNFDDNTYEFLPGNVFSVQLKGSSWDGEIFHPIAYWNNIFIGLYTIKNGTLSLQAHTYIDGDNGKTSPSSELLTYEIRESSAMEITVYNSREKRTEVWRRIASGY